MGLFGTVSDDDCREAPLQLPLVPTAKPSSKTRRGATVQPPPPPPPPQVRFRKDVRWPGPEERWELQVRTSPGLVSQVPAKARRPGVPFGAGHPGNPHGPAGRGQLPRGAPEAGQAAGNNLGTRLKPRLSVNFQTCHVSRRLRGRKGGTETRHRAKRRVHRGWTAPSRSRTLAGTWSGPLRPASPSARGRRSDRGGARAPAPRDRPLAAPRAEPEPRAPRARGGAPLPGPGPERRRAFAPPTPSGLGEGWGRRPRLRHRSPGLRLLGDRAQVGRRRAGSSALSAARGAGSARAARPPPARPAGKAGGPLPRSPLRPRPPDSSVTPDPDPGPDPGRTATPRPRARPQPLTCQRARPRTRRREAGAAPGPGTWRSRQRRWTLRRRSLRRLRGLRRPRRR